MDALAATQKFEIFGTTRKGVSEKLASKGVKAIKFRYGDVAAAENAIKESGADLVWFVTLMGSRATEVHPPSLPSHPSLPSLRPSLPPSPPQ